jgi:hypothetical protein
MVHGTANSVTGIFGFFSYYHDLLLLVVTVVVAAVVAAALSVAFEVHVNKSCDC